MKFSAFDEQGEMLREQVYFSVGGGFIVADGEAAPSIQSSAPSIPYPFTSAAELLATAATHNLTIAELMLANESAHRSADEVRSEILRIWQVMQACVERGMATEGILPGGLNVRRRAKRLAERLAARESEGKVGDPLAPLDWVTVYAMAVNEENAAGGRVVTAPTNGAAGVIPAVAHYYRNFVAGPSSNLTKASCATSSPRPRSASSTKRTPRSAAPRSAARARSASPARWPPADSSPRWAAATTRSNTPPRSAWSTTSA